MWFSFIICFQRTARLLAQAKNHLPLASRQPLSYTTDMQYMIIERLGTYMYILAEYTINFLDEGMADTFTTPDS